MTTETDDLFGNEDFEYDPDKNYVDQLVGDQKKYSDQNKLAYSRIEADRYIKRLEQENDSFRKEAASTDQLQLANQRLEELVTKLSATREPNNQSAGSGDNQGRERDGATGLTPEQAEAIVESKMRERANLDRSVSSVKRAFGEDYQPKLDAEARKLGVTKEFVNQLAKSNPAAFERMFVGSAKTDDSNILPPSSTVNTTNTRTSNERTQKYYSELKKSNPTLYKSKEIQQQEYKDAMRLGEKFFDA